MPNCKMIFALNLAFICLIIHSFNQKRKYFASNTRCWGYKMNKTQSLFLKKFLFQWRKEKENEYLPPIHVLMYLGYIDRILENTKFWHLFHSELGQEGKDLRNKFLRIGDLQPNIKGCSENIWDCGMVLCIWFKCQSLGNEELWYWLSQRKVTLLMGIEPQLVSIG